MTLKTTYTILRLHTILILGIPLSVMSSSVLASPSQPNHESPRSTVVHSIEDSFVTSSTPKSLSRGSHPSSDVSQESRFPWRVQTFLPPQEQKDGVDVDLPSSPLLTSLEPSAEGVMAGTVLDQMKKEPLSFPVIRFSDEQPPKTMLGSFLGLFSKKKEVHCMNITQEDVQELSDLIGKPMSKSSLCPQTFASQTPSALVQEISERFKVPVHVSEQIVSTAHTEAQKRKLDPVLVLSVIATESSFNPKARSHAGALGLMQAIPKWHQDKIHRLGIERHELFNVQENIALGTAILREYLNASKGNTRRALQKYNGSSGDKKQRYSNKVMSHYSWLQRHARSER